LNNSLDDEVIEKIVQNLQQNLSESELHTLSESRVGNLARSLKQIVGQRGKTQFKEYEKMVSGVYLNKFKHRQERNADKANQGQDEGENDNPEEGHVISKENLAVREALTELKKEFNEEYLIEDALFKTDFYIPSAKLAIEINGKTHYYPYTTRFNNFTNLKMKTMRHAGINVLNLNSWTLEGFIRNENRSGLMDLIRKTVTTYENGGPPKREYQNQQ
jgi:very-short-patch-repair endonuclease